MLIVVGGHSRNVGKTSVVAGIVAATPEKQWTAIKVTQYGHGICSDHGGECGCADPVHPFVIEEELERGSGTDTSRFLDAGAARVYWARTAMGQLGEAWPELEPLLKNGNVICESNSLLQFVRPDLYVVVLDLGVADFKESSLRYLDRADILLVRSDSGRQVWDGVSRKLFVGKRVVRFRPPEYVGPELIEAITSR